MRYILLYRLIFSAIPQAWVCNSSSFNFPSFLLIHLDIIPPGSLLYNSPSIRSVILQLFDIPSGSWLFHFFFDFAPLIPLLGFFRVHLLEDPYDRMFVLSYPYQRVPSFEWYLGSQGGERISKFVFTSLSVLYAKGLEFQLQPLRPSPVGC